MTLNREKLIETTAKAMLKYNSFTEDCAQLGTFEETWESTKWHWLKMAEDALKAIGGYLPSVKYYIADYQDNKVIDREIFFPFEGEELDKIWNDATDNYAQFKNICEGK